MDASASDGSVCPGCVVEFIHEETGARAWEPLDGGWGEVAMSDAAA